MTSCAGTARTTSVTDQISPYLVISRHPLSIFQPIRFICAVCLFFIFADANYALVVTDSSDYLQGDASASPVPGDPKSQESPEEVDNV